MSRITDERLESLLESYYAADPGDPPEIKAEGRDKKVLPFTKRRVIAAAACLALASAIGVSAFIILNKPVVKTVAPDATVQTETAAKTETVEAVAPTDSTASAKTEKPTQKNTPSENDAPTAVPGYGQALSAPDTPVPGTSGDSQTPRQPTQAASEAGSSGEKPTEKASPTEAETSAATSAPEPTAPDDPTVGPTDNGELAPVNVKAEWEDYVAHQSLYGVVDQSMLTGSGKVYFRIFAFDGSPIGDEELFSESNLAYLDPYQYNTLKASYYLGGLEEEISKIRQGDCLTYCFYNEDGDVICTRIKIF